ncbi:MAG: hypothetical protein JKY34_05090 [Kordiimonadaceae bacterium]|nr:hypothetical protein [Kordiimonadaceae bacterium]
MAETIGKKEFSGKSNHSKPSHAQIRYLARGVSEPGGKLPLFDNSGQRIKEQTIRACIAHGWCKPWYHNSIDPSWLVCKLTDDGRNIVEHLA